MDLKITFLGGAGAIGASCLLVEEGAQAVVVDCGVRFDPQAPLPDLDRLTGKHLQAILLTHAHSDHSGGLPVLHSAFPGVPVCMTPPTFDLVKILQKDALKLMELGMQQEGELPLYQEAQVESMLQRVELLHHWEKRTLGQWEITFLPASHILGASMIHIATPHGRVLCTGDFSVTPQKTVPALDPPQLPVDLLISESTYGARLHADRKASEAALVASIREVVMNGGRVLIPCFAIGRAQEVLLIIREAMLHSQLPQVPVFVDGMVRYACNIYTAHDRYVSHTVQKAGRQGHVFYDDNISPITSPGERFKVIQTAPCIIVASSGMLSGGPSALYAAHLAANKNDAIFITGYQDEESPGAALLKLAQNPEAKKTIKLGGQSVEVACRFEAYSLSAHADKMQICGLISALRPRTVAFVHGDSDAKQSLKNVAPCGDVELAWDGMALERSYRMTRRSISRTPAAPPASPDIAAFLRARIGDEPGPFAVAELAEAFLGKSPTPLEQSQFASQMEATGLLKRCDKRRWLCKRVKIKASEPNSPAEPAAGASPDDLVYALKQENPKGRLNELCLRERLPHPEILLARQDDGRYCCLLQMNAVGRVFKTARHLGESKIVAEQLACKELLAQLAAYFAGATGPAPASPVSKEPVAASSATVPAPAMAREIPPAPRAEMCKWSANIEAKAKLNHYCQIGALQKTEFRLLKTEGPAHQPVFVMAGRATLMNGDVVNGDEIRSDTKKKGELMAADALLAALHDYPLFVAELDELDAIMSGDPQRQDDDIDAMAVSELANLLRVQDRSQEARLPFSYLQGLAKDIIACGKIDDQGWIADQLERLHMRWETRKCQIAIKEGHYPFVQFTRAIYDVLAQNYGMWTLDLMRQYLEDARRVFPKWAAQFAGALNKIGQEEASLHTGDLYAFVTSHTAWEESACERDQLDELMAEAGMDRLRNRLSANDPE